MTITYWTNFSKRKNSTKQATTGTDLTVKLKEECSIINPIFQSATMPANTNYIYVADWARYYFVTNVVYITNTIKEFSCEVDVLASFKSAIGSSVAHIAYSSTGWDKDLTDGRIAIKGTKTIYHDSKSVGLSSNGCYIIGVVNNDSDGKLGGLSYYRISGSELARLIDNMMKKDFFDNVQEYFAGSPMDFIQSCIWVPVDGTGFVGTLKLNLYLGDSVVGDYSTTPPEPANISVYPITTPVKELSPIVSLSLGSKWQDFRDNQPYTSASLFLPGVGLTDLNINDFYDSNNVNVQTIFDITTGDCTYKIYDDTNELLKTITFNTAASVSLSQVNINAGGALTGIGGAVGGIVGLGMSAVAMNPLGMAGSAVGILAGASSAIMAANQRSTSIKGTNGGRSGFYDALASVVVIRQDTEDCDDASYIARIGRPVGLTHAISNHSGFVQCENASVNVGGTSLEKDRVNQYLNTGFYYE